MTAASSVGTNLDVNTCAGAAATNYSFQYVPGTAVVNQAALTVTAPSTSTTYGTAPVVTASYTGFQNGDGPGSLATVPACSSAQAVKPIE